jgi:hypothetical protein
MLSSYEAPQFSELFVAYAMLTVVRLPPASGFPDVAIDNRPNILLTENKNVVPVRTWFEVKKSLFNRAENRGTCRSDGMKVVKSARYVA